MSDFQSNAASPFSTLQLLYHNSYMSSGLLPPPMETCELWCLLQGDNKRPFQVTAGVRQNMFQLKELIQRKKAALLSVDPSDIVLWKLVNPLEIKPVKTLSTRLPRFSSEFFVNLEEPSDTILSHFPEGVPKDRLHIIVERPATSITVPLPQPPAISQLEKLPSEHTLHQLWMLAREPQSTLFETRQVQRDESCPSIELPLNCMVLKGGDWARKLEPDSRLTDVLIRDEYVVALRAIIDFFLGNETTEDAMEVDDIEPAPLAFDVPLGLVSKNRGFILLGDPGIGKTVLLYVLLVLRLRAQLPTIYQSRGTHLYYFADDGVYVINLTPRPIATNFTSQFHKSTWCLIDSNDELDSIPGFIRDQDLFIVQASSPRPHRYAWTDKASGSVFRYFMKSWTLSELLVGRVLQRNVCSEAQIKSFSDLYGTSARSVYSNASQPSNYDASLFPKMAKTTYEGVTNLFRKASQLDLEGPVSHQFVTIFPTAGRTRNVFDVTFHSRYLYEKFRDRLSNHKLEAAARLYDMLVRNQITKGPAGFMLEDAVNLIFPRGGEWCLVPMTKSSRKGPKYTHWKNPVGPITPQYLHLGYPGQHISIDIDRHPDETVYAALPLIFFLPGERLDLVDGYYCPSSHVQETFDAFIYEFASKTATVIQVTTAKTHSVKEGGIKWLQRLGVETFRYIAVSTPDTSLDLPFPNEWNNNPTAPSIPEKYLITVESLPEH